MVAPDLLVDVPSFLDGVVLTHRLTETERETDVLDAVDLPGFTRTGLGWQGEEILDYGAATVERAGSARTAGWSPCRRVRSSPFA